MIPEGDIALTLILGTLLIALFIGLVALLLVLSSNRRAKHRAELAELKLARDREVMDAEREAQRQTLQDVARELHDNLGQLLTVVQMGLRDELEGQHDQQRLHTVALTLDQSIEEVRRLGRTLNSDQWADRGFTEALAAEAIRIERLGLARMHMAVHGEPPHLGPDAKTILFRVFQEVVNNALKHASAHAIEVTVDNTGPFSLTITDNGCGFDASVQQAGSGLVNIRRRCALLGFRAELSTAPERGTTWYITREAHGP